MLSILLVHDVTLLNFWDREGASASCGGGVVCCSFVVQNFELYYTPLRHFSLASLSLSTCVVLKIIWFRHKTRIQTRGIYFAGLHVQLQTSYCMQNILKQFRDASFFISIHHTFVCDSDLPSVPN
jgi:hypothetical protein